MNTDATLFLARDHAAELLGEADRERLARLAGEARQAAPAKGSRLASVRWGFFSLLRAAAGSR